jgi:hypothetical protein
MFISKNGLMTPDFPREENITNNKNNDYNNKNQENTFLLNENSINISVSSKNRDFQNQENLELSFEKINPNFIDDINDNDKLLNDYLKNGSNKKKKIKISKISKKNINISKNDDLDCDLQILDFIYNYDSFQNNNTNTNTLQETIIENKKFFHFEKTDQKANIRVLDQNLKNKSEIFEIKSNKEMQISQNNSNIDDLNLNKQIMNPVENNINKVIKENDKNIEINHKHTFDDYLKNLENSYNSQNNLNIIFIEDNSNKSSEKDYSIKKKVNLVNLDEKELEVIDINDDSDSDLEIIEDKKMRDCLLNDLSKKFLIEKNLSSSKTIEEGNIEIESENKNQLDEFNPKAISEIHKLAKKDFFSTSFSFQNPQNYNKNKKKIIEKNIVTTQ